VDDQKGNGLFRGRILPLHRWAFFAMTAAPVDRSFIVMEIDAIFVNALTANEQMSIMF
jgi:hypothetical protein